MSLWENWEIELFGEVDGIVPKKPTWKFIQDFQIEIVDISFGWGKITVF